ncbi:MAG: glycyl-radical enzyme activating protein [Treponema sp.]|nr:glycyl-radical enzyme activating protein [Treponema sp.]
MVFDIQRYSIHDGPGIRTLVFLKGCPLQCLWCANPESWLPKPQLFYRPAVCIHCGECVKAAPDKGITMDGEGGELRINFASLNKRDLSWTKACPTGALNIKGVSMSVNEVFTIVMRDEIFYRQSGGGITLSGGEPLAQPEFAKALLLEARRNLISAAVETSGEVPLETILAVSHYADFFLYDVKIFDEEKHCRYTGSSNRNIKENLSALAGTGAEILVRMPLIPGVNDSPEDLQKILDYLRGIGVTRFTILPYHQYGSGKYASIGMAYALSALSPPENAAIERLKNQIAEAGFSQE